MAYAADVLGGMVITCDCWSSGALPHGAVGWYVVCSLLFLARPNQTSLENTSITCKMYLSPLIRVFLINRIDKIAQYKSSLQAVIM